MISVQNIKSEIFNSNVYVITSSSNEEVFLVDCGGFEPVLNVLPKKAVVKGIFLTHYHYDHIYFIKNWIKKYPDVKFYGSGITLEGLSNPKRNLSFYHEEPIEILEVHYQVLSENEKIQLFRDSIIKVFETEGHCEGSLTFLIEKFVFTGDALIPNIPIVTKLKTGNKQRAEESVRKIRSITEENFIICPGHLKTYNYQDVDWNLYLND